MDDDLPQGLEAVLLLGPTGAGKTPLGDWLEGAGLWGRRCHHFDFGANLRAIVAAGPSDRFSSDEVGFLQRVLEEGALLENESFRLAERILGAFIARRGVRTDHWLVLNGLPRHVGQAKTMSRLLHVSALIELECDARVVWERLRRDTGGDRALRTDDHRVLVARKLATYGERTRPLTAFYQQQGTRLISIPVGVETRPQDISQQIERVPPAA